MKKIYIYIALLLPIIIHAQQQITLQNAIDTALKNNFDIQIARNYSEINKINNSFGMAGGLPSINFTAEDNGSVTDIYQKLNSGSDINKSNVKGSNINANITASMTLFNGFKIIATKERLSCLQKQSELELNQQIQNTIAAIMVKYYDIVRQESYFKIIQNSLEVSKKKLEIIKERVNVGMSNDADILQAQIDVNIVEQNIKGQQLIIDQAKADLLQLMSVKKFIPFTIIDTIIINKNIQLDSIINYLNNNPQYLSAEQQIKINEQIVKEIAALRFPSVKVNTGYNFSNIKSDASTTLLNQNYGPSLGVTLQIPIYNGNIYKKQRNAALYNVKNAKLQKDNLLNLLKTDAIKTFLSYNNTLQQLSSQFNNYELSKKLVNLVIQRFQVNQTTIIDVKTAQASFENSGYLLVNLQYAAKIAEIELNRLIYKLGY